MDLTPVTCNNCGAALQVAESARFVTCRYCGAQLEIKRNESSISTEILQQIDQNTAAMVEDLHAIRRESELERLDREWNARREQLFVRNKEGATQAPTVALGYISIVIGCVMGGIMVVVFSVFASVFAVAAQASNAPGIFSVLPCVLPLFPLGIVALSIFVGVRIISAGRRYQAEERSYLERRAALLGSGQGEAVSGAGQER